MKEYFKWIGACVFAFFWMALISPTFAGWLAGTPLNAPTADGQINESGALITSIFQSLFYVIGFGPIGYVFLRRYLPTT